MVGKAHIVIFIEAVKTLNGNSFTLYNELVDRLLKGLGIFIMVITLSIAEMVTVLFISIIGCNVVAVNVSATES